MMTIKELAEELQVSKQAIRNQVSKLPPTYYQVGTNKTILINEKGSDIIREKIKKRGVKKKQNIDSKLDTNLVASLKAQLEEKDKQINQLQILLNNQQMITLQANKQIELLESKSKEDEYQKIIFGLYRKVK